MEFKLIIFVFIVSALIEQSFCNNVALRSSNFVKEPVCDVQARVAEGCSYIVPNTRSLTECLMLCLSNIDCIGASLDTSDVCYHHNIICLNVTGCTTVDTNHRYFARYCVRSHWDYANQSCSCDNDLYGPRCNSYPKHCRVLLDKNYGLGYYWLYVDPDEDGQNPARVKCINVPKTSYHAVDIFRNNGVFNFNKTWLEYREGFEHDEDNYWSGLRGWNELSKIGCTRTVFAIYFNYPTTTNRFRRYSNLLLSDENDKFTFTFSSSQRSAKGTLSPWSAFGECLEPIQNVPFSTWDRDNDGVAEENCAARNGNGWWFNGNCDNPCNALGWGFNYLNSKESYELMSILQIRLDSLFEKVSYTQIYLECFY